MTARKKLLVWAVFVVGMVQSPQYALTPVINQIKTTVFPQYSLSSIQTVLMLASIVSPFFSLGTATLIRRRLVSKRIVIPAGLVIMGLTGLMSLVLNTELWHLCLLSVMTGCATGCFLSNMTSVLMDCFELEERQKITGLQTVFINAGGFIFSILGGLLSTIAWYGGYMVFLTGFPVAVLAYLAIPPGLAGDRHTNSPEHRVKSKLNPNVFYYALAIMSFMLLFGVCGANLSVHLARAGFTSPGIAGVASAIQMGGGGVCGLVFGKLSRKLRDTLLPIGFFIAFAGFSVLNLFGGSVVMIFLGAFLIGVAFSLIMPQCVVSVSNLVDETTSATATAIAAGFAPALGGFLSPVIITRLTTALGGDSTGYRYQFTAFLALALAAAFCTGNYMRSKNSTRKLSELL